jgi:hypothetical protein
MRRFLAAILLAASLDGVADTPYSIDVSDLWWNRDESGWGINLAQQHDMVFATLFVYGPDGRPHWYSASAMRGSRTGGRDVAFSGVLAESFGPTQPGAFIASEVVRREVGSISFQTRGDNQADLTYSVDGVTVTKRVERLTMKATDASGEYRGDVGMGCAGDNTPVSIRILQSPGSFSMETANGSASCSFTGTPQWRGRILGVTGTFSCNFGWQGTFELSNMNVTYQGFVGHLSQASLGCSREFHIGGVSAEGSRAARASADISDLWWTPDESGWGINFQQQDNMLFGTLFTYGAQRQPKWYSASDLRVSFVIDGGLPSFDGGLYESTGPSFATAFNPAAVTRRRVGDFHASPIPGTPDELNLTWSVDGASYAKRVKRFTTKGNDSSGAYRGTYAFSRTCRSGTGTGFESANFSITQAHGSFSLESAEANQTCAYKGPVEARGRMLWSAGTYACGGFLPESGTYVISELEVGQDGLIGQLQRTATNTLGGNVGCTTAGRILGVRPN